MSKRILLMVNNDEDIRQVLLDRLASYGYIVQSVRAAWEAVEALEQHAFDGILLDIKNTKSDETDVLPHIRSTHPTVPIVMTAHRTDYDRALLMVGSLGVQAILPMPFDSIQFKRLAERWFGPCS